MTLSELIDKGLIKTHQTNATEMQNFRELIKRDLDDASIEQLSVDRRFATAYSAALNLARFAIAIAGYRVLAKAGLHATSFVTAKAILGTQSHDFIHFFDLCRRKRNKVDYDLANVATKTELVELLEQARAFNLFIEEFVSKISRS